MKWEEVKLGEYADVLSGYAYKSSDFCSNGVPVIKITNVKPPIISLEEVSYIPEEIANAKQQYILEYNDVLIAMTGSHVNQMNSVVGRVGRVKYEVKSVLNQRVGKIFVKDNSRLDLTFLYYYLGQEKIKFELANVATGSANQANISPNNIRALLIPCPPLDKQQRIASILSAYDDLIENNQKQIKLLEEAAQRLYKEWFVDLRFPGYENVEIIDGLPSGWEWKRLDEIADVIMGQSPKSEFYNNNFEGLPFHQGVGSYGNRYVKDDVYSSVKTKVAEAGSVLFSVRAPVGRLNITRNKIVIGRGLSAMNHKNGYQSYLFYMLKERFFKEDLMGNGSVYASISKDELLSIKFCVPSEVLLKRFNNIVCEFDRKILVIDEQISKLQELRDRLLPKLMSGEVEV